MKTTKAKTKKAKRKTKKTRASAQERRGVAVAAAQVAAKHTIDMEQRVTLLENFIRDSMHVSFDGVKAGKLLGDAPEVPATH